MRFKYVLRRLLLAPGFTTIAVITLGIGIGANTAIFSVIEGVLLKPLSYSHPEQLIDVNHTAPGVNILDAGSAPFLYFTYRDEGRSFQNVGLVNGDAVSITGSGEPEHVQTLDVTADVLPVLSVQPLIGRAFSQKDDSPGASRTAMLTYGYWQRKFGGDAAVLGRRLIVDGKATEIIGVLPAGFRFMDMKLSMLQPLQLDRNKTYVGNFSYRSVARLKPGVTMAQASADIARMIPIALHKFPPFAGFNIEMFVKARLAPKLHRQGAMGADGNYRYGVVDCLRQCREPAAGASRWTTAGAGDPGCLGGEPFAVGGGAFDGEHDAGSVRRGAGARAGLWRDSSAARVGTFIYSALGSNFDRCTCAAVYPGGLAICRAPVRSDPGP